MNERDVDLLGGAHGPAAALAMRILVRCAALLEAPSFIDIESAHIDGCLYHGRASLDFVDRMVADGGRVVVPTTLNVGSLDLIHPELFRGSSTLRADADRLMKAHISLGCEPSFTCAPYQLARRPRFGQQIAWAESNAIVFANSVLGARTNRYGDFIDLCAAITGRAPYCGLHVEANRAGEIIFDVPDFPCARDERDLHYASLGLLIGERAGSRIPVITGLPDDTTEDELKALGAAAATTGAVALFHAVGITPEATTLAAALGERRVPEPMRITRADLDGVRSRLGHTRVGDRIAAVSVGTPHFSLTEFATLERLLEAEQGRPAVDFYVNTSRYILWRLEENGAAGRLRSAGIQFVTDTCTYITPVMRQTRGRVMTNSGKWAHYAPSNIGVNVALGSLRECVRSAIAGEVRLDDGV